VVQSGTTSRVFGETRAERAIAGVFIQQKLGFVDRLFLTGALRMDASSVFGVDERLQFYPKASAAYVVSDEAFWQNSRLGRTLGHFKLRSSIGWSGGLTAIGPFDRFTNFGPQSYIGQPGLQPSAQLGALNVRPERQRELEVGVDAGLFDRRLSIEATYYNQNTTDLLLNRSVAPTTGFLNRLQNIGTLRNTGFELMVTAVPLNQERVRWTSSFIFNTNSNEVSGIEEDVLIFPSSFGLTGAVNGESIGVFFGSAFERDESGNVLDQNGNILDRDGDGLYRLRTGTPQEAGDGVPARAAENQIIGDPTPDFTASWTNEFVIAQNLRLRAQIDAVYGQDVFNFTRRLAALSAFGTLEDYQRELEGDLPSGYTGTTFNIFEHWVEDGSFIKLRELSLSYTLFPTQLPVESIRLNLAARNLFSIDSYSGYDPEVNVGGQRTTTRNFDFVEVPIPRSFSLGATLNF
jgi:outer membrane receptor protein involved in Fe transport